MSHAARATKTNSVGTPRSRQSSPPPPRVAMRPPPPSASEQARYAREPAPDAEANRIDEADFEALIRRASTRPPRPLLAPDPVFDLGIAALEEPSSLAIALENGQSGIRELTPLREREPEPRPARDGSAAMIILPWSLLALGVVGVVAIWPSASNGAPTVVVAADAPPTGAPPKRKLVRIEAASAAGSPALAPTSEVREARAQRDHSARTREPSASSPDERARAVAAAGPSSTEAVVASTDAIAPVVSEMTPVATEATSANRTDVLSRMGSLLGSSPSVTTTTIAAPAPALPDHPSRAEVASALRRVHGAVDACTDHAGSVSIRLTVATDGSVTTASASGAFAGTSEGACMAEAVRRARFPAFTSGPMSIVYPFVLRAP